jgi:hypothetical protein
MSFQSDVEKHGTNRCTCHAVLPKQVRVSAGTYEHNVDVSNVPEQQPVRFDVALPMAVPRAAQRVWTMPRWQRIFHRQLRH